MLASVLLLSGCNTDPGYGGKSSSDWIQQLSSPDPEARRVAAAALGKVLKIRPDAGKIVDALGIAIRDTSDEVRSAAATALTTEGVNPAAALEGFHAALHDSAHAGMRAATARMIGTLGRQRGRLLIPAISELMDDPDPVVREAGIESLGQMGPDPGIDLERISHRISDPDPSVRRAVLQTLLNLRAAASIAVPVARVALRDSAASVRITAAYTLGSLGSAAAPAIPELRVALTDSAPFVRAGAANAMAAIGPAARAAIPELSQLLRDSSVSVRNAAIQAIAAISGKRSAGGYSEPTQQEKCASNPHAPGC